MELLLRMVHLIVRIDKTHLHSNMELLLLFILPSYGNITLIYIPIWSYCYKRKCLLLPLQRKIYIPIWSYCYENITIICSIYIKFTFQYGATATQGGQKTEQQVNINLHSNMELLLPSAKVILKLLFSIFTFQYGATATIS